MFASQVTKAVEIPGYGTFVIRKLNRKRQNEAFSHAQLANAEQFKRIGGSAFVNDVNKIDKDTKAEIEKRVEAEKLQADGFANYDRTTLIKHGVVTWPNDAPAPSDQQIEDLDPELEEPLAREIYNLFRPKTEEEQKKD